MSDKNKKILYGVLAGIIILLALLWYYQSQGFIKVFPTEEERQDRRLLEIDESKFASPEGLSDEKYREQLQNLYTQRETVLSNPDNAQEWFVFGSLIDFFNVHDQAAEIWKKTLALQPQHFVAANNLGNLYQYFLNDFPRAEEYYLQALFAKSDHTPTYQGLIDLYQYNYLQKQNLLEPLVIRAATDDPPNAAAYYVILTEFFVRKENLPKAEEYLEKIEPLSPESAQRLRDKYPEL